MTRPRPDIDFLSAVLRDAADGRKAGTATPVQLRMAALATEVLASEATIPAEERRWSDFAIANGLRGAVDRDPGGPEYVLAEDTVRWALAEHTAGRGTPAAIREGLRACRVLLKRRPRLDYHALGIRMALVLSGASVYTEDPE